MKQHSDIGASSAYRWWECPGSVALIQKAPPQEDSIYAIEGSAAHELAEKCFKRKEDPLEWVGEAIEVKDHIIKVTTEMAEAVDLYLLRIYADLDIYKNAEYGIETSFCLKDVDKEAYGRNDFWLYQPFGRLNIYDFKYGEGTSVEVKENKQLLYYGLGALIGRDPEEVVLNIIQPRMDHPDGRMRSAAYSLGYMANFKTALREKIADTREKDAPLKEGKHCKFCPALGICPQVRKEIAKTTITDFKGTALPAPESLSVDQVKQILDKTYLIVDFVAAVENHAKHLAETGVEIPGYKLVKKKANRRWIDEDLVIIELQSVYGEKIFTPRKIVSPAQLEKLAGKGKLDNFIFKPDAGTSLVSNKDRREPVKPTAISDFSAERL